MPAKQVLEHLHEALGEAAPSQSFVYKWYKEFFTGQRESVQTLPSSGRPIAQFTDENISRLFKFMDPQLKSTLTCIAGSLELSKASVQISYLQQTHVLVLQFVYTVKFTNFYHTLRG